MAWETVLQGRLVAVDCTSLPMIHEAVMQGRVEAAHRPF